MIGKNLRKIIQQFLVMFCMLKKKKIYPAFLKQLKSRKTCLMISKGEGWHYLAFKKVSALLRGIFIV